jgi:hypothetical protein
MVFEVHRPTGCRSEIVKAIMSALDVDCRGFCPLECTKGRTADNNFHHSKQKQQDRRCTASFLKVGSCWTRAPRCVEVYLQKDR